jgi:hypothetical protein
MAGEIVMAALVAAIHAFWFGVKDVDARDKPAHDGPGAVVVSFSRHWWRALVRSCPAQGCAGQDAADEIAPLLHLGPGGFLA